MSASFQLSPLEKAIDQLSGGGMIILVDDEDRENEGDVVAAATNITAEQVAFMMKKARGLVCAPLARERLEFLGLPQQAKENESPYGTRFAVSVDHVDIVREGAGASSRAWTMRRLVQSDCSDEFVSPGNVFPLEVHPGGVFERRGQTEGSFDLTALAGLTPGAVICEVLAKDGSMARGEVLESFAKLYNLPIVSVEQVVACRERRSREELARHVEVASVLRSSL